MDFLTTTIRPCASTHTHQDAHRGTRLAVQTHSAFLGIGKATRGTHVYIPTHRELIGAAVPRKFHCVQVECYASPKGMTRQERRRLRRTTVNRHTRFYGCPHRKECRGYRTHIDVHVEDNRGRGEGESQTKLFRLAADYKLPPGRNFPRKKGHSDSLARLGKFRFPVIRRYFISLARALETISRGSGVKLAEYRKAGPSRQGIAIKYIYISLPRVKLSLSGARARLFIRILSAPVVII